MVRSRSRSPVARRVERRRSRSRSRERDNRRRRSPVDKFREREREPVRRRRSRSYSPPPPRRPRSISPDVIEIRPGPSIPIPNPVQPIVIKAADLEGKSEEEVEMMQAMGFSGFNSTKGKHVEGNDTYVCSIQRKRRYRQYMNRRGGFNRPLDFIA